MTTIALSPSPLPRSPASCEQWREYRPNYLSAYNIVLNAERHANEQVEADPSNREAKDNVMFARVAAYLLLELFSRRAILSETPCVSLVKQLISPPPDGDTVQAVVFRVGKWHCDYFLRTCAFGFFPSSFDISFSWQIGHPLRSTQHPPFTLRVPPSTRCSR
jgi:hypothetical protein